MIQRSQCRIIAFGEPLHAFVGRQLHGFAAAEVDRHAPEQALMIGQMRTQQRGEIQLGSLAQACGGQCERIAIDRIEALVTGCCAEQQHHFIGRVDA